MHGRPHIGANGVSWRPWKNGWKIKKRKHAKKSSFLCLCYILWAIRAGRCRERRDADHTFIQIYFRMQHFVVKFSLPEAARCIDPLTKILRTFLRRWLNRWPADRQSSALSNVPSCRTINGEKFVGSAVWCAYCPVRLILCRSFACAA